MNEQIILPLTFVLNRVVGGGAGASPIYLRARREHVDRSSI